MCPKRHPPDRSDIVADLSKAMFLAMLGDTVFVGNALEKSLKHEAYSET